MSECINFPLGLASVARLPRQGSVQPAEGGLQGESRAPPPHLGKEPGVPGYSRFKMFLLSSSSTAGLWLSRLRKNTRITFCTIVAACRVHLGSAGGRVPKSWRRGGDLWWQPLAGQSCRILSRREVAFCHGAPGVDPPPPRGVWLIFSPADRSPTAGCPPGGRKPLLPRPSMGGHCHRCLLQRHLSRSCPQRPGRQPSAGEGQQAPPLASRPRLPAQQSGAAAAEGGAPLPASPLPPPLQPQPAPTPPAPSRAENEPFQQFRVERVRGSGQKQIHKIKKRLVRRKRHN